MDPNVIYHEKFAARGFIAIFGFITVLIISITMYILLEEFSEPFLPFIFLNLILFFFFLFLTFGFGIFSITLTDETITVGYSIKKIQIPLGNVSGIHLDEVSALRYGGFGIRVAKVQGKLILVYNTLGTPRCVLTLKEGRFPEFVFSTKNQEEVINVIRAQLNLTK